MVRGKRREQKKRGIKGEEINKGEKSKRTRKTKGEDRLGARKRRKNREKVVERREIDGAINGQASGKQGKKQGKRKLPREIY